MKRTADRGGRPDVLFADAGIIGVRASPDEGATDAWDQTVRVGLMGTLLTVRDALSP